MFLRGFSCGIPHDETRIIRSNKKLVLIIRQVDDEADLVVAKPLLGQCSLLRHQHRGWENKACNPTIVGLSGSIPHKWKRNLFAASLAPRGITHNAIEPGWQTAEILNEIRVRYRGEAIPVGRSGH